MPHCYAPVSGLDAAPRRGLKRPGLPFSMPGRGGRHRMYRPEAIRIVESHFRNQSAPRKASLSVGFRPRASFAVFAVLAMRAHAAPVFGKYLSVRSAEVLNRAARARARSSVGPESGFRARASMRVCSALAMRVCRLYSRIRAHTSAPRPDLMALATFNFRLSSLLSLSSGVRLLASFLLNSSFSSALGWVTLV